MYHVSARLSLKVSFVHLLFSSTFVMTSNKPHDQDTPSDSAGCFFPNLCTKFEKTRIKVDVEPQMDTIDKMLYGDFMEYLGRCENRILK